MLLHVILIAYRRIYLKLRYAETLSYLNLSFKFHNYPFHFIDRMGSEEYEEEALLSEEKLEDLQGANLGTGAKSWAAVGWIMTIIGMISLVYVWLDFSYWRT